MTKRRLAQIERRIEKIKAELAEMGEMRPGSLTRQYKDPESGSGPYYQLRVRAEITPCFQLGLIS